METMRGKKDHQGQQDLHQDGEMTGRREVGEITVELIEMTEERKSAEIGGKKETKTPSHDLPVRGRGHQADVLGPQQGGQDQEHVPLRGEGREPVQDIMSRYPRFLLTFPAVTLWS